MRKVKPEVRLLVRPSFDEDELDNYLQSIDTIWLPSDRGLDAENLIEAAGRLCYRSWEPGLNPNVHKVRTDQREYLTNILASGHGSILEHANFTFLFSNVSRVFTHELVRHRAGSAFSQESMRYVRLTDIPFWFPEWAQQDSELMRRAVWLLGEMEQFQQWMSEHFQLDEANTKFSEKKHKTSFMRRFAPEGVATAILWTANIRTLRHVITERTSPGAEEEIRLVFDEVVRTIRHECPVLFSDFHPNPDGSWVPRHRKV